MVASLVAEQFMHPPRSVIFLGPRTPNIKLLIPAFVGATAMLILGGWYFGSTERRFADAI